MILWLTVSGEQLSEVDGEGDPVLTEDRVTVAPQADVHGAGPGLRRQAGEHDWLVGEVVHAPALTFVRRKPVKERKHKQTLINIIPFRICLANQTLKPPKISNHFILFDHTASPDYIT
jgi:hypothetical protein